MKRKGLIIGGIIGACILFSCVGFGLGSFLTSDAATAGDDFMDALKEGDFSFAPN